MVIFPQPSEPLGSRRMGEVIAALCKSADWVLFDAPPVIAATDAVVLASKVDGVLLVVNEGKTTREHARGANAHALRGQFDLALAQMLGCELWTADRKFYKAAQSQAKSCGLGRFRT